MLRVELLHVKVECETASALDSTDGRCPALPLLRRAHALFITLGVPHEVAAIEAQLRLSTPARSLSRIPHG